LIPRSIRREKSLGTAVAVKIHVMAHDRGDTLFGVAVLLLSVVAGIGTLRDGDTLLGVTLLLFGVAMLLFGVAGLLDGVALLRDGDTLAGVAMLLVLLFSVAMLLLGVAKLRNQHRA